MNRLEFRTLQRAPIILLAKDEENEFRVTREAMKAVPYAVDLHRVNNGKEALMLLRRQSNFSTVPTPDLVLLDLWMPGTDGMETLQEILSDETLKHLPIIVLTAEDTPKTVYESYRHCCNAFIVKPLDFFELRDILQVTCEFWFLCAKLPSGLN